MKRIAILCGGGSSSEVEVSLRSGHGVYNALKTQLETEIFELSEDRLPQDLDPEKAIVFPLGHGEFMEDGGLQSLLEEKNFEYAGSNAASSRRCMNKTETKAIAQALGFLTPKGCRYCEQTFETLWDFCEGAFVIKPKDKGSSVGVSKIFSLKDFELCRDGLDRGEWIVEQCIQGKEITVGMLGNRALPVIEIRAKNGFYDYRHKYTSGMTEYCVPAPIAAELTQKIQHVSGKIFVACECRDFGRLDFILDNTGNFYFLEANTIPGMTETSLLPKAAAQEGISFQELCRKMIDFAIARDKHARP